MKKTFKKNRLPARKLLLKIGLYVLAIAIVAIILFPIVWMLPGAWKTKQEFSSALYDISWLPKSATWKNFTYVFEVSVNGGIFSRALLVTTAVSVIGTVLVVFVNSLAGFGFARFDFFGKKFLFAYALFTMFIPGITTMLTSVRLCNMLHITNTLLVLFLPGVAGGYNTFFFRQYYLSLPASLEEAAMIDGASRARIYFEIFLPMSVTPIVIIGVGAFMGHWNNYLWPTLTITDNEEWLTQIMQVIHSLSGSPASRYGNGIVIAATLISLLVPFSLYAVCQKYIVDGIAISGLK